LRIAPKLQNRLKQAITNVCKVKRSCRRWRSCGRKYNFGRRRIFKRSRTVGLNFNLILFELIFQKI
jgi:hypothetical protein